MPQARHVVVSREEVGVYHCVSRCVRRAFLCGRDGYSGRDFEHRRKWVRERLEELSGLFAVEVFCYAVMSNHLHIVLRTRPDWADSWSGDEVVERWCRLFRGKAAIQAGKAYDEKKYYTTLVEWTGRTIREDKPGYIPVELKSVLDRYGLDAAAWAENVEAYGSLFHRIADSAERMLSFALERGQSWFRGRNGSEQLYESAEKAA